jgi:ATP-dependent RNA helicase MSS116, mitochondrial
MFNACRRGPASLSRVLRAGSTLRIPSTRPSTLFLVSKNTTIPSLESRWLHISSQLRQQATGVAAGETSHRQKRVEITKFDELIEHNLVHPNVVTEITRGMGLSTMTEVQSKTINQSLGGIDM